MPDRSYFAIRALALATRGAVLHRWGLEALHAGRFDTAAVMFEAAVRRYRRELAVEPIARLRVHQLMAQVLSGTEPALATERCLEVERRLCQLDRIEALTSPHDLVDAHSLLGTWFDAGDVSEGFQAENMPLSRAA